MLKEELKLFTIYLLKLLNDCVPWTSNTLYTESYNGEHSFGTGFSILEQIKQNAEINVSGYFLNRKVLYKTSKADSAIC